jgi:uncharacterized protein
MAEAERETIPWGLRDILWAFLTGLIATGFAIRAVMEIFEAIDPQISSPIVISIETALAYACFAASAYYFLVVRRGVSLKDLGFASVPGSTLARMLLVYLGMTFAMGMVTAVATEILGNPPAPGEQLLGAEEVALSGADTLSLFVAAALIGPVVEELYFRGLVFRYLRARFSVIAAVIISAALFAAAHPFVALMPALFVLGVVLAIVTQRYSSLYPAIVLHVLTNSVAVLVLGFA